jgi:caffeoyl-CoA O-methyltransferase
MSRGRLPITDALHEYIQAVSLRETPLMRRLRKETAQLPYADMQIAPEQGQFMALLVSLLRARRAIEIGVFTGYSGLCVAQALPDNGQLIACDISEQWTGIAMRYWREAEVDHKISLHIAPALETLNRLLEQGERGRFDFAFIDADKGNYDAYYEACLELLRPGGLIAIDNVLWGGSVVDAKARDEDTRAIRALNAKIHQDDRVEISLITLGDGLMLACKR